MKTYWKDDIKLIKFQQNIFQNKNQKLSYHYIKFCVLNQMHFFKKTFSQYLIEQKPLAK